MAREKKNSIRISSQNEHLLDVLSNDLYLELGSIDYEPLNNLLNKKLVDFKDLSDYDILKDGLGSMRCDSQELQYKLPFLKFDNIVSKNKSYRLVLTYGLLVHRNGYKETFIPIILIPVKLYFENDTILVQMISKPMINNHIKLENNDKKVNITNEKLDTVYNMDRFIMSFLNNHTNNIRSESYLTIINLEEPDINLYHDKFHLDSEAGSEFIDKYNVNENGDIYNITTLDKNQRNAVAMASKGYSFAITGYEGTGKTTTLINIASDAIKNGKRVLYVSNNDSTLRKVYETFKENDLQGYVSLLNQSFDKVNERINENRKGQMLESVVKSDLKNLYQQVDDLAGKFAEKTHNYSLLEVMNELILTPKPKQIFDEKVMKNAYKLYKQEVKEVLNALSNIEKLMKDMPSFTNSHFINIPITNVITDANVPIGLIEKIYLNYCILKEEKDILEKNYGFSKLTNLALFKNRIKDYIKLNKLLVPSSWYKVDETQKSLRDRFANFKYANNLYNQIKEEILTYNSIDYTINSLYHSEYVNFNINKAIEMIMGKYFKIDDSNINKVLTDYENIDIELKKAVEYCNELKLNFARIKSRLGLTIDLSETKIINEILDFIFVLDKGYFSKVWCDYENREGIYKKMVSIEETLDQYEESMKLHSKVFDSLAGLDNNIRILERKKKDENSKYRGVLVSSLLNALYFIRTNTMKIVQLRKEYKELTYDEYKYNVHISDVYKEFIDKHDQISDKTTRIQIEKAFQDLRGSGIIDILSLAKDMKKAMLNVNISYSYFVQYNLVNNDKNFVTKISEIREIEKYAKNLLNCQRTMKSLLKTNNEVVLFDAYLTLAQNLQALNDIKRSINTNEDYKYLYQNLFNGEKTDIELLQQVIKDFDLYIDIFNDANSLIKSFEPKFNGQIVIHLQNSESIIEDIANQFQTYVKIFKVNTSKYHYDEFKKVIYYFKTLKDSKEELKLYLNITEQLRVLLKYKLNGLLNYIYQNSHDLFTERFKYTYFQHLYNDFININEGFDKNDIHETLLNDITYGEKDLIDNNVEVIKYSNKVYRTGKVNHLDYNDYIEKNNNAKLLYLTDTVISNTFLNIDLFNLVLIDDAHMLNASVYNKVIKCKQVIICGCEQVQTSVHNNLISRLRSSSILKLKYKYDKSPLLLLSQLTNLNGRFYSEKENNKGIYVTNEDYRSILLELYHENPQGKINFFTSSYTTIHSIYEEIGKELYDKWLSFDQICEYFKYTLNVSDLSVGYLINADYNVLDLHSYCNVNDEFICDNMINALLSCSKKLIIYDSKDDLKQERKSKFITKLSQAIEFELPHCVLQNNTVINKISNSLKRYRINAVGVYYPLHLVVEYDNKYYGIMLFENPSNTEFTIMNKYREFKSNDFPIIIIWLSSLVEDYDKTISGIVKEIRS